MHLFVFQLCSKGSVTELSKSLIEKGRKMDEMMVAYVLRETLQVSTSSLSQQLQIKFFMPPPFSMEGVVWWYLQYHHCLYVSSVSIYMKMVSVQYLLKRLVYWIHILYTGI